MRKWYVNRYVDKILCLMSGRKLAYLDAYDTADRIMDLNFYNNFKNRYNRIHKLASTPGGIGFDMLVSTYEWEDDMINYIRGKRPYPYGLIWTKIKIIFAVMNVEVKHFLAVEILLEEGMIKSKLMDYFPVKVLMKKIWNFEGQNKGMQLQNIKTGTVCGPYSLAYIKCLLISIEMFNLFDAVVAKMQEV
ncbi:hypothetical protein FXO38_25098 [Capsicum annuum]|nr:hypothetical protein FXO37_30314 [Capsicum annuum]KAF3634495.1 hypothetical protein FXO38_25098 [Capsicum annuum]